MSQPSPTLKRLWLAATALLALLLTLVIGNALLPDAKRLTSDMVGHDFLAFYTAGTFVREGRSRDLYHLDKVRAFQHDLAAREHIEIGESFGPFWNPPFYAWVFVPLSTLPFKTALLVWELVNVACLVGSMFLLMRLCRFRCAERPSPFEGKRSAQRNLRVTALIPVLLLTSMPLVQALSHGQNTMTSLLLLTLTATFWRSGRAVPAAFAAALLLYKPQLGLLVAVAVGLTLGRRAVFSLAVGGVALLLVNVLTLPGTIGDYRALMPGNLYRFQVEQPYLWHRHVTLRAFWRLFLQGPAPGPMSPLATTAWLTTSAALALLLVRTWWRGRRDSSADRAPLIAAVVAAMPLLMPFYFDYDLLLVGVAAVCYAATRLASTTPHPADRYLTPAWCTLYLWLNVNVSVAGQTHVNGTVLLLSAVAMLLAWRATPPHPLRQQVNFPGLPLAEPA